MLRIDLSGQMPILNDAGVGSLNLDTQYQHKLTGVGANLTKVGNHANGTIPDTFPIMMLPEDSGFPGPYPSGTLVEFAGDRPRTVNIIDGIRKGWFEWDTASAGYPVPGGVGYFIEPWLICGICRLTITDSGGLNLGVTGGPHPEYLQVRNDTDYLTKTWRELLEEYYGITLTDPLTAVIPRVGSTSFVLEGLTFNITTPAVGADNFEIVLTEPVSGNHWHYFVYLNETPWQTVSRPGRCNLWNPIFNTNSILYADRGVYTSIKFQPFRLPPDLLRIKWVSKIPIESQRRQLASSGTSLTETPMNVADIQEYTYSPIDNKFHFYPITESMFTEGKLWHFIDNAYYGYSGGYMQVGQQLHFLYNGDIRDLIIALYYIGLPDRIPQTTAWADFDTTYVDLPDIAMEGFAHYLLVRYFLSKSQPDMAAAQSHQTLGDQVFAEVADMLKVRMGQSDDGQQLRQELAGRPRSAYFGASILPTLPSRYPETNTHLSDWMTPEDLKE